MHVFLCNVIVHNSFWIKKNRASDNEGKFHTYLKVRIWIWNKKFNFSMDIRVSVKFAFFEKIWLFLSTLVLATSGCKTVSSVFFQQNLDHHKSEISSVKVLPVQEWSKRTKFSQKNAKFMLTLMSKEKLNFLFQIQILTFKYVWNLPSLSLARFFLIQNELRPGCNLT